jgi:hypothetical protein
MTTVRLSLSVLEYRQALAELVDEVYEENARAAADFDQDPNLVIPRTEVPELCMPGLLRPPKIEMVWPDLTLKNGHLDGLILIHTSEYFGVMNVYVTLVDDQGNHLEGDFALDNEYVKNHWGYVASAPASPGRTIIVRAIALDELGGIGIAQESIRI